MKKITVIAALLGTTYFSQAQVGIGTSEPSASSQLDVFATDKGILIPRVGLNSTTEATPIADPAESLLVYNTETRGDVTPGFYYWQTAQWERVVNQTQLNELVNELVGDLTNLQNLADYLVPTNPDATIAGGPDHTSVVYNPATQEFSFVIYENGVYTSTPIDLSSLVTGAETKTFVRKVEDAATGVVTYYYFNEEAIAAWLAEDSNNTADNIPAANGLAIEVTGDIVNNFELLLDQTTTYEGNSTTIQEIIQQIAAEAEGNVIYTNIGDAATPNWVFQYWNGTQYQTISLNDLVTAAESQTTIVMYENRQYYLSETYIADGGETNPAEWTSVPSGAILIDVVGGVVNNFQEFVDGTVTIDGNVYTVEEYIEYISQNAMEDGVIRIVLDTTGQAVLQIWNDTNGTWDLASNNTFETIVRDNETDTSIVRNETGAAGAVQITYNYFNETQPDISGTPQATINVNTDIISLIENNTEIQNAITNILNTGGNVYYGDHDADPATEDVFYTIDPDTGNTPIDISEVVVNAIVNATTTQLQEVKNVLGDTYSETTVTDTGDTWIDGGKIYKGVYSATLTGGTANLDSATPIQLTPGTTGGTVGDVISIKILNASTNTIINTTTTDVTVSATGLLSFKIGTGNMYTVLSSADMDIKVIVEYSAN